MRLLSNASSEQVNVLYLALGACVCRGRFCLEVNVDCLDFALGGRIGHKACCRRFPVPSHFLGAIAITVTFLACQSPETVIPAGCLGAEGIEAMRAEWNADPEATEAKYVGQELCVYTDTWSVNNRDQTISVSGGVGGAAVGVLYYKKLLHSQVVDVDEERERAKTLEKWAKGKKEGDILVAKCTVMDFVDSETHIGELGTPELGDGIDRCELIRE